MKITYINDQIFPLRDTDAEQIISMVTAFANVGANVDLLLPRKWGQKPVSLDEINKYYEVQGKFNVHTIRSVYPSHREIEKLIHGPRSVFDDRVKNADVVYTRNIPTVLAALKFGKKPVVYETYRAWPDQEKKLRGLLRKMTRHPRFLAGILHSRFAGKSFVNNGMPKKKLLVAHNGYDPKRMRPILSKAQARANLGLAEHKYIVTYTGRIAAEKGIGTIIDMANKMPHVHFVLVGSQGHNEMEQLAAVIDNVQFVPWQQYSKTTPYLYASDVLIVPPTEKPLLQAGTTVLPIKTFFYMASKRPILGPSASDLKEVLSDGENAVLVEPDNISLICEKLETLLVDTQKQELLGSKAANDVEALTWDARAIRILKFLKNRL